MKRRTTVVCVMTAIIANLALLGGPSVAAEKKPKPQAAPAKVVGKDPTPKVKKKVRPTNRLQIRKEPRPGKDGSCSQRLQKARRITKALDGEIMLDFNEAPLSEVVDYLETLREIPIVIDTRALDEVGLGTDTPLNVNLSGITLRSALKIMLGQLDLTYAVRDEVLMITTEEEARLQLDPRIYPIENWQPGRLVALIPQVIAPETWRQAGGTGYIAPIDGGLVVAQTDRVHGQIADFIHKLQRAADQLSANR